MNLQEMIDAINRRVDDSVGVTDAVEWLNAGKNQMAMAIGANFPSLTSTDMDATFVFDEMYHEAPVLYACASFKEQDSSLGEAENFHARFEHLKKEFVRNYTIPPRYRNDHLSQQFTVENENTTFTITKNTYDVRYGDLVVYVNDRKFTDFTTNENEFTCAGVVNGDAVTAVWEEHSDLIDPPYNWWNW